MSRFRALLMGVMAAIGVAGRRAQIDCALQNYLDRRAGDNTKKLSVEQVADLRDQLVGSSVSAVARTFRVSRTHVRRIRDGVKRRRDTQRWVAAGRFEVLL